MTPSENDKNEKEKKEKDLYYVNFLNSLDLDKLNKAMDDIDQNAELLSLPMKEDQFHYYVSAYSLEEGLSKGAKYFNMSPKDLKYQIIHEPDIDSTGKPLSPYHLIVYPNLLSGEIEIKVSSDKLTAFIPILYKLDSAGHPYTLCEILERIEKAGIQYGKDLTHLEKIYDEYQKKQESIPDVVIAKGLSPINTVPDGFFLTVLDELYSEEKDFFKVSSPYGSRLMEAFSCAASEEILLRAPAVLPVSKDQTIARFRRGIPGTPGCDVYCREIQPEIENDSILFPGAKVRLNTENELESTCFGYLFVHAGKISIQSPLWVSPDHLTVKLIWLESIGKFSIPTREEILVLLKNQSIACGISEEAIEVLIKLLQDNPRSKTAYTLTSGFPALPGIDSKVTFYFDTTISPGQIASDGRIDYHEINYVREVKKDQVIVEKIPSKPGKDGIDVYGKVIPYKPGRDISIEAGSKVAVLHTDAEKIRYVAAITGRVSFLNNTLSVYRLLRIDNDVNYSTGNIRFDGDVRITGSVKSTFSILASGDVIINGYIENGGQVKAGGHVVVSKGILGKSTSVKAGGCIKAQFVENAELSSEGDIHIGSHCFGARIHCAGMVNIPGKGFSGKESGVIVGGAIFAFKGILAKSVGSIYNSNTELIVGINPKIQDELFKIEKTIHLYEQNAKKLMRTIGEGIFKTDNLDEIVKMLSGDRRKVLMVYLNKLKEINSIQEKLKRQELEHRKKVVSQSTKYKIVIQETIFPFVNIRIGNRFMRTNDLFSTVEFRIDPRTDSIVW